MEPTKQETQTTINDLPLFQLGYERAFCDLRKEFARLFNTNRKDLIKNMTEFLYTKPLPTVDYFKD